MLYIPTSRPQNGLTLGGETSSQDIGGGRFKVGGQQDATTMLEIQEATATTCGRRARRVSFYSYVNLDVGKLATEMEQLKKVCFNNLYLLVLFAPIILNI